MSAFAAFRLFGKLLGRSVFFLILGTAFACGESADQGNLNGHFEDFDAEELEPYRGRLSVIAEHAPSQGIVMSYSMFTEHRREDMAQAFLNAGIDTLWVVVPFGYTAEEAQKDLSALNEVVGDDKRRIQLLRQPLKGELREWARDFGPLTARGADGRLVLMDFNYYSDRPADDSVPSELAKMMNVSRVSMPIYNEGGNFMSNTRGDCLMTERVLIANDEAEVESDMILDREKITAYYEGLAGCRTVQIFPAMPHEGTRHIDLWSKFIDDDTVIVAEISEKIQALSHYRDEERAKVGEIRKYLDARAQDLGNLGFKIVRVPMPAPFFSSDGFNLFRSYTNSLILNGRVFIPEYKKPYNVLDGVDGEYIDAAYIDGYAREVERIHGSLGLEVKWIESDSLISKGGAVHCTTMQIAR
jgi:agmatine/peptidylarginine deiminase